MTQDLQLVDLDVPITPTDWLLEPWLARQKVTMLAGQAGSGKSLLSVQWALSLLAQGKRVLIVDAENGPDMMRQRYATMAESLKVDKKALDNLIPLEAQEFDMLTDLDELAGPMKSADMVILDSWVSLWTGSETNVRQIHDVLDKLRFMSQDANCATLLIHHALKSGTSYRGSGAVAGVIEAVYVLSRTKVKTKRLLECNKLRFAAEPDPLSLELLPNCTFAGLDKKAVSIGYQRPRLLMNGYVKTGPMKWSYKAS